MKFLNRTYTPKQTREEEKLTVLPEGIYKFETVFAKEFEDSIYLLLKIELPTVGINKVKVYLKDDDKTWFRKHYCDSIGKSHLFEQEEINPKEFEGTTGLGKFSQSSKNKDNELRNYAQYFIATKDKKEESIRGAKKLVFTSNLVDDSSIPF